MISEDLHVSAGMGMVSSLNYQRLFRRHRMLSSKKERVIQKRVAKSDKISLQPMKMPFSGAIAKAIQIPA